MVLLFEVLVVNNWQLIMEVYQILTTDWTAIYFIVYLFCVVFLILNLLVAFVLEAFVLQWFLGPLWSPLTHPRNSAKGAAKHDTKKEIIERAATEFGYPSWKTKREKRTVDDFIRQLFAEQIEKALVAGTLEIPTSRMQREL